MKIHHTHIFVVALILGLIFPAMAISIIDLPIRLALVLSTLGNKIVDALVSMDTTSKIAIFVFLATLVAGQVDDVVKSFFKALQNIKVDAKK
ncbi:MAG: hypothetical protein SFZ02_12375 [bacterium]|nr:hypothetical protein [bacterium]